MMDDVKNKPHMLVHLNIQVLQPAQDIWSYLPRQGVHFLAEDTGEND